MTRERGVVLVNVLIALALGAAIVVLMFTSQEVLLERTRRAANATQAEALALAGEASLVTALRRDMIEAPDADHYGEPWAQVAQAEVALATGRFSIDIADAQARLNLNGLAQVGLTQGPNLARLVAALELPPAVAPDLTSFMQNNGPQRSLDDIPILSDTAREALAPHVAFLPVAGKININTADQVVMSAALGSPAAAVQLMKQREAKGFLTLQDVQDTGVIALSGAGFTSNVYDVTVRAEVDGASVVLRSRILRETRLKQPRVIVISRRFGAPDADLPSVTPSPRGTAALQ